LTLYSEDEIEEGCVQIQDIKMTRDKSGNLDSVT